MPVKINLKKNSVLRGFVDAASHLQLIIGDHICKTPKGGMCVTVYSTTLVMLTLQHHGPRPARPHCPCDSPGENTGVALT